MRHVAWLALVSAGCGSSGGPERGDVPDAGSDMASQPPFNINCPGTQTDEVVLALENPTGALASATDAQGVADAFGSLLQGLSPEGQRRPGRRHGIDCGDPGPTDTVECDCSGGGTVVFSASEPGKVGPEVVYEYRDCCIESCCYDGCAWLSVTDTGSYTQCASFSLTGSCPEPTFLDYSYCLDSSGLAWYLVAYLGESFAVSGSYTAGIGGSWTVRDAATEWTCSEDGTGAGSCTDGVDLLAW